MTILFFLQEKHQKSISCKWKWKCVQCSIKIQISIFMMKKFRNFAIFLFTCQSSKENFQLNNSHIKDLPFNTAKKLHFFISFITSFVSPQIVSVFNTINNTKNPFYLCWIRFCISQANFLWPSTKRISQDYCHSWSREMFTIVKSCILKIFHKSATQSFKKLTTSKKIDARFFRCTSIFRKKIIIFIEMSHLVCSKDFSRHGKKQMFTSNDCFPPFFYSFLVKLFKTSN